MPYSTEFDYERGNRIARQSTIPSSRNWRLDAHAKREAARKAAEEEEMYNWYLQNRGVMSPEGDYYGPELSAAPQLDYDPTVRQVGQPMRRREAYPQYDERLMENVGDLVLGYDPREGAEGYFERPTNPAETAVFGAAFAPGRVGRAAGALLGADIAYDIARGRRVPGAIDVMWLGGMGARAAKKAAWMYYQDKLTRAIRKRAARQAKRRALNAPKVRRQNARTGRWDEVNAYPEFVPYEEVRF